MSDIAIYLILLALLAGFWIWELWVSKKFSGRKPLPEGSTVSHSVSSYDTGEMRYNEMTLNLTSLLRKHEDDDFITLTLRQVALPDDCRKILHSLIPGDRLHLFRESSGCDGGFSVFHEGRLVGVISHFDSARVEEIMKDAIVTGVYVWKQNCFGDCSYTDLDIVLFYEAREISVTSMKDYPSHPYKLLIVGLRPFTLYQN